MSKGLRMLVSGKACGCVSLGMWGVGCWAETGETADAPEWNMRDGRTEVTLDFDPSGSVFVVFRRPAGDAKGSSRRKRQETVHEQSVAGCWELAFPSGWDAPEKLRLDSLCSWTDVPDDGVRYFSGTATYSTRVTLDRTVGAGTDYVPNSNSQQSSSPGFRILH